jgi:uncharacterized PurR-regulated membrane protein YhhQ (DUF165 family)
MSKQYSVGRPAGITAIAFFLIWIALALLVADFPPSAEFVLVVTVLIGLSLVVYVRVATHLERRSYGFLSFLAVIFEGFFAGVVVALLFLAVSIRGPQELELEALGRWFGYLGGLGSGTALFCLILARFIDGPAPKPEKRESAEV